jgi:hypothetical protein
VSNYRLVGQLSPGGADVAAVDVGAVTTLASQVPAGTFYVAAIASNACGVSARSNTVRVDVGGAAALPAPQNLRAAVIGNFVAVVWDPVPGAASYLIEAGSTPGASDVAIIPIGDTRVSGDNVGNGTYYVRVRALGAGGVSAPSFEIEINVPSGRR